MKAAKIAGLCALCVFYAGAAQALTISNLDSEARKITVTVGSDSKDLSIDPGKQVDAGCSSGCKVKLPNGEIYELKGGETASIEGGVMYVDQSPDANIADIPNIDPDAKPK